MLRPSSWLNTWFATKKQRIYRTTIWPSAFYCIMQRFVPENAAACCFYNRVSSPIYHIPHTFQPHENTSSTYFQEYYPANTSFEFPFCSPHLGSLRLHSTRGWNNFPEHFSLAWMLHTFSSNHSTSHSAVRAHWLAAPTTAEEIILDCGQGDIGWSFVRCYFPLQKLSQVGYYSYTFLRVLITNSPSWVLLCTSPPHIYPKHWKGAKDHFWCIPFNSVGRICFCDSGFLFYLVFIHILWHFGKSGEIPSPTVWLLCGLVPPWAPMELHIWKICPEKALQVGVSYTCISIYWFCLSL